MDFCSYHEVKKLLCARVVCERECKREKERMGVSMRKFGFGIKLKSKKEKGKRLRLIGGPKNKPASVQPAFVSETKRTRRLSYLCQFYVLFLLFVACELQQKLDRLNLLQWCPSERFRSLHFLHFVLLA